MPDTAAQIVHKEMMRAMTRSLIGLQGGVAKYPGKPAGSTYRRTLTLGRSLTMGRAMTSSGAGRLSIAEVKPITGGVQGRWGTNVKYARWVIDKTRQAKHMRHWWTLQDEARRMTPMVRREFEGASQRIAQQLGPRWTRTIVIEVNV